MRNLILTIVIMIFSGCGIGLFNCNVHRYYHPKTEEQKLINAVFTYIFTKGGYDTLKKDKKIYVTQIPAFNWEKSRWDTTQVEYFDQKEITIYDIPPKINAYEFCLKTKEELQEIADKTNDFMYLIIGMISANEEYGKIGIGVGWQTQTIPTVMYLSGGISVYQFKKVNGNWVFDRITFSMES